MKPMRTALFSPGNRPDRVEKGIASGADSVIIDLEDAVPLSEKENARSLVRSIIDRYPGKRLYVRVNSLTTPYCKDDLAAVVCGNLKGVLFPKVESPEDIFEIERLLCEVENETGLEEGIIEVMTLCETAKGLEEIYPIVSTKPKHHQLSMVAFGAADYTLDLGITLTKGGEELEYPRSRIPIACRAAGIMPPIDSPWMIDLKDMDGLVADARRAKAYGFQGKLVIHPNQIEPCHDIFTPSEDEIAKAKKIIDAFEEAEHQGSASIQIEGKFIDYAVVEKARRTYALAQAISRKFGQVS
jgi:citrate lyase subunit beta/citryl-CoA lyase